MAMTVIGVLVLTVAGGLVVLGAIAGAVRAWQRRHPDPAWHAAVRIQKYKGYDQDKAIAARHRALDLETASRKLAAQRSRPAPAGHAPRHGNVVGIDKARRAR
jgi:hypothetical protein